MDVFDLSAKISLDTSEYEKGLTSAEQKTNSFGNAIGGGLSKVAKVGATAIAGVATAVAGVSALFVKGAADVAEYGDNIDKMSQKMGISAEAYQEWDAVLQHSGTSIDAMSRGMQTLQKNAVNSAEKFEKLGISQKQLAEMSTEDLFAATIEGLQNMGEGAERTALASELLGTSAKELGALLNTSAEETQAMKDRVHELGGVMSDEAVKAAAKYKDTLQDMKTAFSGVSRGIQTEFLPAITTVMEGLTDLFSGGDGYDKINDGINQFVEKVGDALPKIVEVGTRIITSLVESVVQNLPQIIKSIADVLVKNAPVVVDAVKKVLTTIGDFIFEEIPQILQVAIKAITSFIKSLPNVIQGVKRLLPQIIRIATDLVASVVDALPDIMEALIDALPEILETVFQILVENIDIIINAVVRIFNAIVAALPRMISMIVDALPRLMVMIVREIPNIITTIVKALTKAIPQIIRGIVQVVKEIARQLPTILVSIIEALVEFGPEIAEAFGDMFFSIIGMIPEIAGALFDAAWELGKAIIDGIAAFFADPVGALTVGAEWLLSMIFGEDVTVGEVADAFEQWWNNEGLGALSSENWSDILAGCELMMEDAGTFLLSQIFGQNVTLKEVEDAFTEWWNTDGLGAITSEDWNTILSGLASVIFEDSSWFTDALFGSMGGATPAEKVADTVIGVLEPLNGLMGKLDEMGVGWNNFWSGVAGTWDVGNAITALGGGTLQFNVGNWLDGSVFKPFRDAWDEFKKWWDEGWDFAFSIIIETFDKYKNPIAAIWDLIKQSFPVNEAYDWGVELVESFFNGIMATLSSFTIGGGIVDAAKAKGADAGNRIAGPNYSNPNSVVSPAFGGGSDSGTYGNVGGTGGSRRMASDDFGTTSWDVSKFSTPEPAESVSRGANNNYAAELASANMGRMVELLEDIAENGTNVTLAGDAAGIFNVVERENRKRTTATRYNSLSMVRS